MNKQRFTITVHKGGHNDDGEMLYYFTCKERKIQPSQTTDPMTTMHWITNLIMYLFDVKPKFEFEYEGF